ncbi:SDR family oxidoreductase [Demequina aurantiaca]|uniref:SDR family oxidoreductase n=1 Tax=Demequina aurantiaca TaxID=676200 RepID=UPI0007844353|nr:SDR family oxidoreductase [Demequina aurantiaca]
MSTQPERIAIVGGHGKIARLLIPMLIDQGHEVVALARRDEQLEHLATLGAIPRRLDIEKASEDDFAAAFGRSDAVVFAAGGGADGDIERKRTVDLEGSLKSIAGARTSGAYRFVQISAIGVDQPVPDDAGEVWAAYVAAKRDADAALRASDLAWTIVRPGGLTDDDPMGRVQLATEVERGTVPRADVAAVIAATLRIPQSAGHQWEVVSGNSPIDEAIREASTQ